jgi:hypothetical protein
MTIWRVEGRDLKSGEPVDVTLEAETEEAAKEKARKAGIWIQRVFDDALTPTLLRGPVARSRLAKFRPRKAKPKPRFVVQVVQHGTMSEQLNLIFTIGAGIMLGFWLTIVSLLLLWGYFLGLSAMFRGWSYPPAPAPSFSTPTPGQGQAP